MIRLVAAALAWLGAVAAWSGQTPAPAGVDAAFAGEAEALFPPAGESGRVDLARTGNNVEARTRGVGAFTLLLSPDQFDLDRALTVVVNGRTVFDGTVRKNIRTLVAWAARDNDRTMLFAAELPIEVPGG